MSNEKMNEKLQGKDLAISQMIARATLRTGRLLNTSTGDSLMKAVGLIGLLNQAQLLVGKDNKMARRLLEKANTQNA